MKNFQFFEKMFIENLSIVEVVIYFIKNDFNSDPIKSVKHQQTSRERPKSALYLRLEKLEVLEIVIRWAPHPVRNSSLLQSMKMRSKLFDFFSKNELRFLKSVTVPKKGKGGLFGIFSKNWKRRKRQKLKGGHC